MFELCLKIISSSCHLSHTMSFVLHSTPTLMTSFLPSSTSPALSGSDTSSSFSSQDFCIRRQQIRRKSRNERSGSASEELRRNPLHRSTETKTHTKMNDTKKYRAINCMNCRTGCRSSERILSMKVLQQSLGETRSREVNTFPVLLVNYQWSREQKWNRYRESKVSTRTFRRTQIPRSA